MTARECKFYDRCNAPLCPLDPKEIIVEVIWYPDEDICRIRKNVPQWVKQQRKIAKKAKPENFWFYFTLSMLNIPFRCTTSVRGLDPNKEEPPQMKAWLKTHKGVKPRKMTDKQKQALAKGRARKVTKGETG